MTANRTGYWTDDSWWQVNVGAALEALNENNPEAEVVALKLENVYGQMMQQNYPPTAIICMVPVFSKARQKLSSIWIGWLTMRTIRFFVMALRVRTTLWLTVFRPTFIWTTRTCPTTL